jgi:hypothetical protein
MVLWAIVLAGCADWTPPPPAADANGPYVLDSGDKLRILVFGQEALSNSYAVDAAGKITMPLIGAVGARGMSTEALSQATPRIYARAMSASRMWPSRSSPIAHSSSWRNYNSRPVCLRSRNDS